MLRIRCRRCGTASCCPTDRTGPHGPPAIYLAGQSLGLQPRSARDAVEAVLDRWARLGVDGWFTAERPWFTYDDSLREPMARIVGARPAEIAILNSLTVNIHLLLTSFFRPAGPRRRILVDAPLFPSDRHALTSHLAARGLDPIADLIVVAPRTGEATLRPDDLASRDRRPRRTSRWSSSPASTSRPDRSSTSSASPRPGMPPGRRSCGTSPMRPATSSWRSTTGASMSPRGAPTSTSTAGRARSARSSSTSGPRGRHAPATGRLVGHRRRPSVRDGRALRAGRRRRRLEGVDRIRCWRSRRSPPHWRSSTRSGCRPCARGPSR